jgi:hypothetical protein
MVQSVESVASNPPFAMTEVGDGVLELDKVLVDTIAEEGKSVEEAELKAKVVAELSNSEEGMVEVATSVDKLMVLDALLKVVDERDEASSMDETSLELATGTVDEGEDDSSMNELEIRMVEDAILEIAFEVVLVTDTEKDDALGVSDALLDATSDEVVIKIKESEASETALLETTSDEMIVGDILGDALLRTTSEEVRTGTAEGDMVAVAMLDCTSGEPTRDEGGADDTDVDVPDSDGEDAATTEGVVLKLGTRTSIDPELVRDPLSEGIAEDVVNGKDLVSEFGDLTSQSPNPGWQPVPQ